MVIEGAREGAEMLLETAPKLRPRY